MIKTFFKDDRKEIVNNYSKNVDKIFKSTKKNEILKYFSVTPGVEMTVIDKSKVKLELTKKLGEVFKGTPNGEINVNLKDDNSVVTEIDIFVSNLIKDELSQNELNFNFYSEEDHSELSFPSAILDPIDGTKELVNGKAECSVSLALMNSPIIEDKNNYAWIYNPFSGLDIDTNDQFFQRFNIKNQIYLGMVSRTEFDRGYFKKFLDLDSKIAITPRGSIAFKLALLASCACDFVLSLSAKNIWDIAAGTILCHQRGIFLYQNGKKIEELSEVNLKGIMIWARPEVADYVWKAISKLK